jgi:dGTPase
MFERVYFGDVVRREHEKIATVIQALFGHYAQRPEEIPDGGGARGADLPQRITDYLAGMTDRYCIRAFTELTVPDAFAG